MVKLVSGFCGCNSSPSTGHRSCGQVVTLLQVPATDLAGELVAVVNVVIFHVPVEVRPSDSRWSHTPHTW